MYLDFYGQQLNQGDEILIVKKTKSQKFIRKTIFNPILLNKKNIVIYKIGMPNRITKN